MPAVALLNGTGVRRMAPRSAVNYVHLLLDDHHILQSKGVLPESFFPSPLAMHGVPDVARAELLRLFPSTDAMFGRFAATARPVVQGPRTMLAA